jgi:nickel transport system permease protein
MGRYILGRVALLVPMMLGVSLVIFFMLRLGRGDPALDWLRLSQIPPTDQAIAEARAYLGLDRPLIVQYLTWLWDALHLDFGKSYVTRRDVFDEFVYYLPATLKLGGFAFALTLGLSIPLGMWAAKHRDRWPDHLVRIIAFLGVSMPNFWFGFLLVVVFSIWLGWLPPFGIGGLSHLIMPALAVALMSLAINARLLRAAMLDAAGQRYVLYARLRGLSERQVTHGHILRNALLPIVTAAGMHLGELIGGTMIIENIFAWPGVGRLAVSAIYNRDYPVLQCFTLLMTLVFVTCNLGIDVLYAWLDPRIRITATEEAAS